jgi:hypothetical protein
MRGFANNFPFSRGYTAENFYRMWRLSANYQLPLFYPEWGIGNIVYFMRVRTNLYYDYTKAMDFFSNGSPYNGQFRSFGPSVLRYELVESAADQFWDPLQPVAGPGF